MGSIFPIRANPFLRPGDVRPGFDPSHLMAGTNGQNALSVVATGNGRFVQIYGPTPGIINSQFGAGAEEDNKELHYLGPSSYVDPIKTAFFSGFGTDAAVTPSFTLASIFELVVLTGGAQPTMAAIGDATHQAATLMLDVNATKFGIETNGTGNTALSSVLPAPALNVPYFYAGSGKGTTCHIVLTRLDTGQTWTDTLTITAPAGSTGTLGDVWCVNNYASSSNNFGEGLGGYQAAYWASRAKTAPEALFRTAREPWAFWYPRPRINRFVGVAAAGGFSPWWAQRGVNLPVIGTGTY